ncbi:hypothetical protein Vafri_63 [Volvox africanus]|nr:hypothetical protein Vafri_63 [Volvox africanus]
MAESQRAKSLVRKVILNGPQTDASKREPTNRSQMPVRFIDLEEIQRELPTGVPVLIDQEAVVLNVHWPAESNTADIHAQLYGPLAAAILKTIYESLLMAEPELSYSPKIGNHHQYKHRNGTVIQEIHVLVPKGGLAKLNSSFAVQQGHLKLGLISLLPNSPPIEVEVHIRNLHKAAPVYWEITGVPPNLAPQAVPSFLAQAYSSARNEWLKRDFQQLNPTKMANTWRVKMAPGSHSLPHEIPYSLRGSNNHRVLIATKLRMVEEEVPFTMPCPPPPRMELKRQCDLQRQQQRQMLLLQQQQQWQKQNQQQQRWQQQQQPQQQQPPPTQQQLQQQQLQQPTVNPSDPGPSRAIHVPTFADIIRRGHQCQDPTHPPAPTPPPQFPTGPHRPAPTPRPPPPPHELAEAAIVAATAVVTRRRAAAAATMANTALTLRVPTVTNANNPPSLLPGQPTKVML